MVTLWGTSDVSGVSGDDERVSMVVAVVVDIDVNGEEQGTMDSTTDVTKKPLAATQVREGPQSLFPTRTPEMLLT